MKNYQYKILAILGFVLWISETCYFGWNEEPSGPLESILDFVSAMMMAWGILGDIASTSYVIRVNNPSKDFKIVTIVNHLQPNDQSK